MSRWRRRLRRLRRGLVQALAGLLILAGLGVALLSQVLPTLQSRPREVAEFMQRQLGVPVQLEAVTAAWTGSGARLELQGLRIGAEDGPRVPEAVLWLRPFSGWLPGNTLSTLQIRAPVLEVERVAEGGWQVRGLGLAAGRDAPLDLQLLERLGEVVLDQASLRLRSEQQGFDLQLSRVDARLRPVGDRLALALQVFVDRNPPLQMRLRAAPDLSEGEMYLSVRRAPITRWLREAFERDWPLPSGLGEADAWIDWSEGSLTRVQFRAELAAAPLAEAAEGPQLRGIEPPSALPTLSLQGGWTPLPDGGEWRIHEVGDAQSSGWLRYVEAGSEHSLQAANWTLDRWWPWLSRSLPLRDPLRQRLQATAGGGLLQAVRVDWSADSEVRWWMTATDLYSQPFARIPGLDGLALRAEGAGQRAILSVQAEPLRLDWRSLPDTLQPRVEGRLMLWRDEREDWCLHALELALQEPDYAIEAEGGLCFDGGAPSADLRVAVAAAEITTAKRFWFLDRMPEKAVSWLDDALQGGQLASGALLLHGDLSDWPFRGGEGRMEAIARLADLTLQFRPDWPQGESLSGVARFINDSLEFEGRAELAGVPIERVTGRIARYRDSRLEVGLQSASEAARLLALLRRTPLWEKLAPGLERVRAHGLARADVQLDLPLKRELGEPAVRGMLALEEVDLRHEAWGIAFDGATGDLQFSGRGLQAESLDVLHVGRPARFSLRVGDTVQDAAQRAEARLSGRLDAGALIDTQPELDWLKPWLSGVSLWDIALDIPQAADAAPSLRLRSDLVGTALRLPAPLRKSAATPLPLALQVDMAQQGRAISLELGELMRLQGLWADQQPFSGAVRFGETTGEVPPGEGLRVAGEVAVLDLGGWMGFAGDGGGLLDRIDLRSGELDLFGRGFGETRLRYQRQDEVRHIAFDGDRLQGEIEMPGGLDLLQRGVTARFARMHWPGDLQAESQARGSGLAPSSLPPLHVHVEDLRIGDAVLGDTRLEAYPLGNGLHVEQFTARSAALSLVARGDWLGDAENTLSRFTVEFTAESLGEMLRALGFAEFVEGGQTLATLEGEWPGAPTAFSLAEINGQLSVSVGKGRIPDVDPGAGRLFGLLSLSEIPRRLALDFSDFFRSGLAFNRIEGDFVLRDGSAITEQLLIDSPAAEIRLSGRTALRAQEYAQTMEVLPRAGNVLPVVGALAAGPAGAAIGAVAQAVLQNPFKQITRTLYSVNGSWANPEIDVIERGPARPSAPGDPGVPGP